MIAIACDHGGFELKKTVMKHLDERGDKYTDFGTYSSEPCDYPDMARKAANAVADGECDAGIIICGTGIGISIAANKVKGIRAALCTNVCMAELTRLHNDANMLALGGRVLDTDTALEIVDKFLDTPFSNEERHIRRIKMIEE